MEQGHMSTPSICHMHANMANMTAVLQATP